MKKNGETAALTQYAPAGKSLFRFYRPSTPYFSEAIERLLLRSEVYLASRKNFNDPFDMNPILKSDWTTTKIRTHMKNVLNNPLTTALPPEAFAKHLTGRVNPSKDAFSTKTIRALKAKFQPYMSQLLDRVGVCCFTEEMQNPLFWAHYAESYTGVCVELKATGDKSHPFCNCMKVHYSEHRPTIYASQTGAFQTVYDQSETDWKHISLFGFCTKSSDWEVEREWRLWLPERANNYQKLPDDTLRSVFLGPLVSQNTTKLILDTTKKSRAEFRVFTTTLSSADFRVDIGKRLF